MTTNKISSEDYLNIKLKPIFNSLTESIVKENPKNPVSFKKLLILYIIIIIVLVIIHV